ncbi:leucyl/phenylalanyl-tRNA--protein transferase [Nocardioides sp. Bht2]|uniref:leucyl/phenylalanyl-tRNA--protein transferase n=1 Tax=Nocardioides sp. Bht2 TaxID=3392297 RepID=UPI0039B52743
MPGTEDLVAIGADLEPGTLLSAYRAGYFPMPLGDVDEVDGEFGWWCPEFRGVLELDGLKVSRSLRKTARRFEIRIDTAFAAVMEGCADPARDGAWISTAIRRAYEELHRLGWAHSVEAWADGELVGGLYGVAVGGLFAGESMFHRERDASKAALIGLVEHLQAQGGNRLIDVQWQTEHLATLGVVELERAEYLRRLEELQETPPAFW